MDPNEAVAFPADLSTLGVEELVSLEARATAEFDALVALDDDIDETGLDRLEELATGIEAVRAALENARAAEPPAPTRQERVAASTRRVGKLRQVAGQPDGGDEPAAPEPAPPAPEPEPVPEPVTAGGARTQPRASLADAQRAAPPVPDRSLEALPIVAASPTRGVQVGSRFDDVDALVAAFQAHSRALAPTHGTPSFLTVATVQNSYDHVIDGDRTSPREVEAIMQKIATPDAVDALVAGGGWCAPSELKYDFFNIVCQDGMVDLPTFGVTRGGVRFPVSPSLADVFTGTFTNATNPWVWTETDDILTVTGTPNKPCVRVPCPAFSEVRLECYGICLTAGNLTDNAYPESTKNHIKLLIAAQYHAMNQRYLAQMQTLSTFAGTITGGGTSTGDTVWSDAPTAVGIAASDIRTRFGMCAADVLEVIFPRWVRQAMKSDVMRRSGIDHPTTVSDADVDAQFAQFNVRVQWVQDWQVRSAGQPGGSTPLLAWPATVDFMIYPAGTVALGNGMSLDLGVVRDSVLNAENDFTASWTEECHLIAMFGHQIRRYTLPVCAGGKVGGTYSNCHSA